MKQIEIKEKRKAREKHFLQENGEIIAQIYDEDIHYFKNGKYEEIDNTLIKNKNCYCNRNNAFRTFFDDSGKDLMTLNSNGNKITMNLKNCNNIIPEKKEYSSKLYSSVFYKNIIDNIDLRYTLTPTKVKEEIILNDSSCSEREIVFVIQSDLKLMMNSDKTISVYGENTNKFTLEAPFMIDSNNQINDNVDYELVKVDNNYELKLILDKEWLKREDTKYPVVVDPTITNNGQNNSVYDTYIYEGDTNVTRYNKDILKVGVEKINGIDRVNRTLLKFDLPEIGTGDQIVNAMLYLIGYPLSDGPFYDRKIINVHQITEEWDESTANWTTMNDKFNSRVENCFESERSELTSNNILNAKLCVCDLTNIVKHWYSDTPNYGIMLKLNNEVYTTSCLPSFYSKNNSVTGNNPKPVLTVTYRNQNGLEDYLKYKGQSFSIGDIYENLYNGNLTFVINVGGTIGGKFPIDLNLVYNTNDVILDKNYGCGVGLKFDLFQTIKEVIIDEVKYLQYLDNTGTIHYFRELNNEYVDENDLGLKIQCTSNKYVMLDKEGNKFHFVIENGIGYLKEMIDLSNNKVTIVYDLENRIIDVLDANNEHVEIIYEEDRILIISPDETVRLNYSNGKLTNISSRQGIVEFQYNENNLISNIRDNDGTGYIYMYYDPKPYRVRKVIEYSTNGTNGKYFELVYDFNTTKIIDNKNRIKILTFNSFGNINSIASLENENTIKNAYGRKKIYGESGNIKNKEISDFIAERHINNYMYNGHFYDDTMNFHSNLASLSITDEISYTGSKCLKIVSEESNAETEYLVIVPKNNLYTLSCYLKNDNDVKIALYYLDYTTGKEVISESDIIKPKSQFEREEITFFYPDNESVSNLYIKITSLTVGTIYIDNIQVEEGAVANNYNYVENSSFFTGLGSWKQVTSVDTALGESTDMTPFESGIFELADVNPNLKALKLNMNPRVTTELNQEICIDGKSGDTYSISFWYKNLGVRPINQSTNNQVILKFIYDEEKNEENQIFSEQLNSDCAEWQYYSAFFTAESDFKSIKLSFIQSFNANEFYFTNIGVYKELKKLDYHYDENGNLISIKNLDNHESAYEYDKNNQLIKSENPKGENLIYEYDNIVSDRILYSISETGICNKFIYDKNGNFTTSKILNYGENDDISDGLFKIRIKGTTKYLKNINNLLKTGNSECNGDLWIIEKIEEFIRIRHSIIKNKLISVAGNKVVLSNVEDDNSLFRLIKNSNGSFLIKHKNEDIYLKYNEIFQVLNLEEGNPYFQYFFENINEEKFIEFNNKYTEDGRFIASQTNYSLNEIQYQVDEATGLKLLEKNANGDIVKFTYNEKNQLIQVESKKEKVKYQYNAQSLLEKIICDNKEYIFEYDEFLNIKNIKIGNDITLILNNYEENNGNLISSTYGNNQTIYYKYNNFDLIEKITKMDNVYSCEYDNSGNLARIISNDDVIKFYYDISKRLLEYRYNNFKLKYDYDENDNIINRTYSLNNIINAINYTYDKDSSISKIVYDDFEINYEYDNLGRLKNKKINDIYVNNYNYVCNGKRETFLVNSVMNGNDKFKYKYDNLNNITHIYFNDTLTNRYFYDYCNQLIKEIDYSRNIIVKYNYDSSGNIINKITTPINDFNILSINRYEYNNLNWKDQLTKFNNDVIEYDQIGNPLLIGNKKLTWINGRQLSCIQDGEKVINYSYDKDGTRIKKTINNIDTIYYTEGDHIIYELLDENIIYYLYDDDGDLEGFKYNNSLYYYIKNIQNDIIGILDNNYNLIAKYEYDSFGNLLKVSDIHNNEIVDRNHIAYKNPFRYRSYYYDEETGLYYLNNRYYNPIWGRFINADSYVSTGQGFLGYNMYIYCNNNFPNASDCYGNFSLFPAISKAAKKVKKTVNKVKKAVTKVVKKVVKKIQKKIVKKIQPIQKTEVNKACATISANQKKKAEFDATKKINDTMKNNAEIVKEKVQSKDSKLVQYATFANLVKPGGVYDIKQNEEWSGKIVSYNGMILEDQDVGNIHYGYIGRAAGFSEEELLLGAGFAQLIGGNPDLKFCLVSACDDPRDTYFVQLGMAIYDAEHL